MENRKCYSRETMLKIRYQNIDAEKNTCQVNIEKAWLPSHKCMFACATQMRIQNSSIETHELISSRKHRAAAHSLFQEIQGILNKITTKTFNELSQFLLELEPRIDTSEKVTEFVNLIFQKVIDDPIYCSIYSDLYFKMIKCQLSQNSNLKNDVSFRWVLLNKCKTEFYELLQSSRKPKIETTSEESEYVLKQEKRKRLGNIRLIGELYLRDILKGETIEECINKLLAETQNLHLESLECLCQLLKIVGKKIDAHLNEKSKTNCYIELENISSKVSSRFKFMIQDLLELRQNQWALKKKF